MNPILSSPYAKVREHLQHPSGAVAGAPIPRYPPAPSTFPKGQLETRGIALVDCRGAFPRIVELDRGDRRPRYDVAGRRLLLSGD